LEHQEIEKTLPRESRFEAPATTAADTKKGDEKLKRGIDPDVGEYQIDLDQPDSFTLGEDLDEENYKRYKEKFGGRGMGYDFDDEEEHEDLEDLYEDEGEYGEEAEDQGFRGSGTAGMSNGFSHLDIIQENEDEHDGSLSKSKSKSAHSSPPQTRSTGDKKESRKAENLEEHDPADYQADVPSSKKSKNQHSPIRIKDTNSKAEDEKFFLKQIQTR
jgi:hypothetical protein